MKNEAKRLADASVLIALKGAHEYLRTNHMQADERALIECIRSHVKAALPAAMHDAKEALEIGADKLAEMTFSLSMMQAGIEAAKEASEPIA